jgi:DME family drug/metabolite transporter
VSTQTPYVTPARTAAGPSLVLLAAALWGTTGTAQAFAPAGAEPVSVGAARIVFGGLALVVIAALRGELRALRGVRATLGRHAPYLLVLGGVGVAAYQLCFFSAVARTGVAVGTVVTIGSAPVFTGLLVWLTRGGRPTRSWLAATAMAVAGCAILTLGGRSAGVEIGGVLLGLASGLGYAAYAVVSARLIRATGSVTAVMAALFGGGGLVLVPVLVLSRPVWLATPSGALVAAHLALVTTAVGYLLYGRALRTTPVATSATLALMEPAVATLLGLLVLGEHLGASGIAGLVLVGAGMAVLAVPHRTRAAAQ